MFIPGKAARLMGYPQVGLLFPKRTLSLSTE